MFNAHVAADAYQLAQACLRPECPGPDRFHLRYPGFTLQVTLDDEQAGELFGSRPPAITVWSLWSVDPELESVLYAKSRFAALAAWFPGQPGEEAGLYSRIVADACDSPASVATLAVAAAMLQVQETIHTLCSLGHPRARELQALAPPELGDILGTVRPAEQFSFGADIDTATARWQAAGHVVSRRGEILHLAGTRGRVAAILDEHPSRGPGLALRASTHLPHGGLDPEVAETWVREVNDADRGNYDFVSAAGLLGSWCTDPDDFRPTFTTFVPEAVLFPGVLVQLVDTGIMRLDWYQQWGRHKLAEDLAIATAIPEGRDPRRPRAVISAA